MIEISARTEHGLDPLLQRLRGHTSILVGQSGVSKSSLINVLIRGGRTLPEGRLSDATGLGRHTTSAATLYPLDSGGELGRFTGRAQLSMSGASSIAELERGFREFLPFRPMPFSQLQCPLTAEPDCAILLPPRPPDPSCAPQSYQHMAVELTAGA